MWPSWSVSATGWRRRNRRHEVSIAAMSSVAYSKWLLDVISALYFVMMNNVIFDVLNYSTVINGSVFIYFIWSRWKATSSVFNTCIAQKSVLTVFFNVLTYSTLYGPDVLFYFYFLIIWRLPKERRNIPPWWSKIKVAGGTWDLVSNTTECKRLGLHLLKTINDFIKLLFCYLSIFWFATIM